MRFLVGSFLIVFIFTGCVKVNKGDYVKYTDSNYMFLENSFIDKSIRCLELGEMKQGGIDVKYCIGHNYASKLVQGFIFKHEYKNFNERFIGSTLSFKTRDIVTLKCTSETVADADNGVEYINCMVSKDNFDIYSFIMASKKDIQGQFRAAVGENTLYNGVIDSEGKALIKAFYVVLSSSDSNKWKKSKL